MFRGQLYAGRLYAGRLFGVEETVTPQPELPLEYHGGGDEAIVRKVIEKWETIERARAKRRYAVEVTPSEETNLAPGERFDAPPVVGTRIEQAEAVQAAHDEAIPAPHEAIQAAIIQPTYAFTKEPVRVAPTKWSAATVVAPAAAQVDDGMEEMMAVLLALDEAGEL